MLETSPATRSKIVLAVDDLPENLAALRAFVTAAGYTFFEAPSGADCLSLTTRVTPRVVLLDVQMPGLDGFATCKRLREQDAMRHVPILFLTARKTAADVIAGVRAGGNDFLTKPVDRERLLQRLQHWIARRV
jgi:DNA-binding response OmpR family regulator